MSDVKTIIIETASQLFYQQGYNSTGINEIIREAGIAKATLYHHFRSKEEICIAYLQHQNQVFRQEIDTFCHAQPAGKTRILAIFDFLHDFYSEEDFNGCWCLRTMAEIPPDNVSIRAEIQRQKSDFMQWIIDLIMNNTAIKSTKEVNAIGRQIYLLYEGAVAESHLHQSDWPIASARKLSQAIMV